MQPTVDVELAAVRRSLEALPGEHELPADAAAVLDAAAKAVRRVEKSWARLPPYLVQDNAVLARLLEELAPLLPEDLQAEIAALASAGTRQPDPFAVEIAAVNERNEALRCLLARAVLAAPQCGAAAEVRRRALACLRETIEKRPW